MNVVFVSSGDLNLFDAANKFMALNCAIPSQSAIKRNMSHGFRYNSPKKKNNRKQ